LPETLKKKSYFLLLARNLHCKLWWTSAVCCWPVCLWAKKLV